MIRRFLTILMIFTFTEIIAMNQKLETATFGGGCFWCTEAIFKSLKGIEDVSSGYSGGHEENPTYSDVCTGETAYKKELNRNKVFNKPVVTEISAFSKFYKAEKYHQDYYQNNSTQGYCQFVIVPKLKKFREIFKQKLK